MSFYDIQDKDERDRTIEDYLATMERIKKRNMDERIAGMQHETDMQEMFKPVLESNAEMANEITQDLVPIQKELKALNETILKRDRINRLQQLQTMSSPRRLPEAPATPLRSRSTSDSGHIGSTAAHYLMKAITEGNDSVTGIRFDGSVMMMGDKKVELQDENNLKVDGEIYRGTPGLWALITEKKPKEYTPQDLEAYKKLMIQTNALYQNNDPTSQRSRANGGEKWKKIQKPIWDGMSTVQGDGILMDILRLYKKIDVFIVDSRGYYRS